MIIREIITFSDAYYESRCLVFSPQNLPKYEQETMKKYGKIVGYFDGSLPNLWITDAVIIRLVFVKDFDHFVNRRVYVDTFVNCSKSHRSI